MVFYNRFMIYLSVAFCILKIFIFKIISFIIANVKQFFLVFYEKKNYMKKNQWSIPPTPKTSSPNNPSSKSLIKSPADKNNPPPTTPPMKVPVTAVVPVVIVNNDAPVFPEICTSVNPNYGSNLNVNVNNNVTSIAPFNPICIDLTNVVNSNTAIDTHFSTAPIINIST